MAEKRPQLSLDELHQLKWLLGGGLALFSAWTVFYLDVNAWALLLLATAGIALALARPAWVARVPAAVHLAAFPVIVGCFLADLWLNGQLLPALIRLDLMLIFYRGISYRLRRDDLQLIVLGLFLVVVTGVLTVSIAFAFQILAFAACALAFLFVITLVDAAEAKDPPARTPLFTWRFAVATPEWAGRVAWRRLAGRIWRLADWRIVTFVLLLFAGVVGLSALLFAAIPRFQLENSLFLDRFIARKARTGFSDNIRFGDVTDILSDNGLAVSVDVSDPREMPATPYLRMVVLDEYRDGSFRLSAALKREMLGRERTTAAVPGSARPGTGRPVTWVFYLESGVSRYLPLPGTFADLRFREVENVAWSTRLGVVALRNEPVTMTAYRLEGVVAGAAQPDAAFAAELRQPAGGGGLVSRRAVAAQEALPAAESDRAVFRRAAAEITGGRSLAPEEFARRACAWLAERHPYSLQSTLPPGPGDPLTRWVESRTPGHCELFAGAYVMLARAAGFPARLVTGFKGGTWNAFSNNLTVRNSDAHAWCEMWDGAGAWLRVDPTPGAEAVANPAAVGSAANLAARADRSWGARLESLRVFWYRRIVNFDQRDQAGTLRALQTSARQTGRRLRAALDAAAELAHRWIASAWTVRRAGAAAIALLAFGTLGWGAPAAWRRWRWRRGRAGSPAGGDGVRAEAGRWLVRLRARAAAGAIEPGLLADLLRLRYGPRGTWADPRGVFARAKGERRRLGRLARGPTPARRGRG